MIRTKKLTVIKYCLAIGIALIVFNNVALGQCTQTVYTYATSQQNSASSLLGASVGSPNKAVDGNHTDFSTLNGGLLGTATEYLQFANTVTSGKPVTVKLSIPSGLLAVLGGVTLQPYIGSSHTAVGASVNPSPTLLGVLNGAGDIEITMTPTGNYDGVRVRISGISVAQSVNVYCAFTSETVSGNGDCGIGVDVLSGVRAITALGSVANALSAVTSPDSAIDNDPGLTTAATINAGLSVASYAYHTTIFNTLSQPGDFVRMVLQDPGGGALILSSLSNVTIQLYNGITAVGLPISTGSGLLSIGLFPGSTDKYQLNIIPPDNTPFDRVEIREGGLADAQLSHGLNIYDVKRVMASPTPAIDGTAVASKAVCAGSTATLSVSDPETSCTTYSWYNVATGGASLQSGTSYTPPAASLTATTNNFYVEAVRTGCTVTSDRTKVTLTVNPLPTITPTPPQICTGIGGTMSVPYTTTNSPNTYSITWNATAHNAGFSDVPDTALPANAINITIPATAAANTYSGTLVVKNANGCINSLGQAINITVNPLPSQPTVSIAN